MTQKNFINFSKKLFYKKKKESEITLTNPYCITPDPTESIIVFKVPTFIAKSAYAYAMWGIVIPMVGSYGKICERTELTRQHVN